MDGANPELYSFVLISCFPGSLPHYSLHLGRCLLHDLKLDLGPVASMEDSGGGGGGATLWGFVLAARLPLYFQ